MHKVFDEINCQNVSKFRYLIYSNEINIGDQKVLKYYRALHLECPVDSRICLEFNFLQISA